MNARQLFILILIFGWPTISSADSSRSFSNDFSISDFDSVPEAVDSIKIILEEQGIKIVGVIDHTANAESVGVKLPPTQLILFRDHRLEEIILSRNSTAAIDMPLTILVFEDPETGAVELLYNSAGYLSDRHNFRSTDHFIKRMNNRFKQFGLLDNGLVTIESKLSVEKTTENIKRVLLENNFLIPFTLSFLNSTLNNSQLIIFSDPAIDSQLMQNQQQSGLDLPQKFMIWEDGESHVHITYNDMLFIGKRHGLQGLNTLLESISSRLGILARTGAGEERR